MRIVKDADINIRTTAGMKMAVARIARDKHTTPSEVGRQALVKYLKEECGITDRELSLSSEAVSEALKLTELATEDVQPLHPTARRKVSKPRRRPGT